MTAQAFGVENRLHLFEVELLLFVAAAGRRPGSSLLLLDEGFHELRCVLGEVVRTVGEVAALVSRDDEQDDVAQEQKTIAAAQQGPRCIRRGFVITQPLEPERDHGEHAHGNAVVFVRGQGLRVILRAGCAQQAQHDGQHRGDDAQGEHQGDDRLHLGLPPPEIVEIHQEGHRHEADGKVQQDGVERAKKRLPAEDAIALGRAQLRGQAESHNGDGQQPTAQPLRTKCFAHKVQDATAPVLEHNGACRWIRLDPGGGGCADLVQANAMIGVVATARRGRAAGCDSARGQAAR